MHTGRNLGTRVIHAAMQVVFDGGAPMPLDKVALEVIYIDVIIDQIVVVHTARRDVHETGLAIAEADVAPCGNS
jgi:hypothetical protein